jgi:FkbM family methyltransferase
MSDTNTFTKVVNLVRKTPLLGPALRRFVRSYPEGSVVSIYSGVGKGLRWKRFHRYDPAAWLGTYEPSIQGLLEKHLRPGDVFYDVGAYAGFFTVLAAHLVGHGGRVVAFEPHPENIESINAQVETNRFGHVALERKAVSASAGAVRFSVGDNLSVGHLGDPLKTGETMMEVEATTLDDALLKYGPPKLIKVDIEGGGVEMARGARRLAEMCKPVWILEVHHTAEEAAFKNLLLPLGYHFRTLDGSLISPEGRLPNHVLAQCED